jgi:hypothetical protein
LDPRIKLKYYQKQEWESEYITNATEIVRNIYDKYYKHITSTSGSQADDSSDFLANVFGNINEIENDELEDYLQKPIIAFKTDPLQWWKVIFLFFF